MIEKRELPVKVLRETSRFVFIQLVEQGTLTKVSKRLFKLRCERGLYRVMNAENLQQIL